MAGNTLDNTRGPVAMVHDASCICVAMASAISSVKVVTRPSGEVDEHGNRGVEYVHEVKLWDKNSALDKIAKQDPK